nr:immunoglobulin light chain junction region [Macaca mulatta]MOX23528.1 immunoglobulin light chain junction region [Macaca mulatta]
CLQYNSDPYTF